MVAASRAGLFGPPCPASSTRRIRRSWSASSSASSLPAGSDVEDEGMAGMIYTLLANGAAVQEGRSRRGGIDKVAAAQNQSNPGLRLTAQALGLSKTALESGRNSNLMAETGNPRFLRPVIAADVDVGQAITFGRDKIGRASCRERV